MKNHNFFFTPAVKMSTLTAFRSLIFYAGEVHVSTAVANFLGLYILEGKTNILLKVHQQLYLLELRVMITG